MVDENTKTGITKCLKSSYGFLQIDGQDRDAFFHTRNIVSPCFEELHIG